MSHKWSFLFGIAVGLLRIAVLAVSVSGIAPARASAAEPTPRTITVVGEGTVSAKPDFARANLGVEVIAPTVAEAVKQNSDKMAAIIAKIKSLGIADKDIQTSNYSINPERSFERGGPGAVTGYRVSNMVLVTIRDLSKVGTVLDQVTQAGATSVFGVSFGIDDPSKQQAEARAKAMAEAQAHANDLAKLGSVTRSDILSISELITPTAITFAEASIRTTAGGAAPIESGMLEVTVRIQVVYTIR